MGDRGPPHRTAITAPTASDGANGMRVLRPDDETAIMTRPKTMPDHEAGQEGHVGVEQAQVADGEPDGPGQAHVAEAHAPGDEPPDGEEEAEGHGPGDRPTRSGVPPVVDRRRGHQQRHDQGHARA